jgi:hypothetical protein
MKFLLNELITEEYCDSENLPPSNNQSIPSIIQHLLERLNAMYKFREEAYKFLTKVHERETVL